MSTVALDIEAVRARFSALRQPLAFFDGPGGTQVPDEVIDAVSRYYRESNANVSGPYATSRRTEALVAQARLTAAEFLRCNPAETIFGANMTTLAFALTRTAGRTWTEGDEIVVTKLDHDANVSPWLELAHDKRLEVRFVDINDDTTVDLDDLQRHLNSRTRVVAFPVASNAVGTLTDVRRIVELAHDAGALAWADAVHYGPHGPIDVGDWGVDVLICSPYNGNARARAARRLRRGGRVHRVDRLGRDPGARARAGRALPGRPARQRDAVRPPQHGRQGRDLRVQR